MVDNWLKRFLETDLNRLFGGKPTIITQQCRACKGHGSFICEICKGMGFTITKEQKPLTRENCTVCDGNGKHPCPVCARTGKESMPNLEA